jgi:CheY-like chemotaxis protein
VASTLLAVDDSVTMRKVLEITFAGPDFKVVTANTPDAALQKLKSDKPDLVISDLSLDPMTGYDLCKAIKKASPGTPVILLSSKQNAFDAAKGSAAQADDHMDKPFDTQQMIDKVKKLLAAQTGAKPNVSGTTAAVKEVTPAAPPGAAIPATAPVAARPPVSPAAVLPAAAAAASAPPQRAKTLIYNPPNAGGVQPPATAVRAPAGPTPVSGLPTTASKAAPQTVVSADPPKPSGDGAGSPVVAAQVNGAMAAKLGELGLSPAQAEAVLALSRDIVERVVWEVVPVLAETIIKEEISRLTK